MTSPKGAIRLDFRGRNLVRTLQIGGELHRCGTCGEDPSPGRCSSTRCSRAEVSSSSPRSRSRRAHRLRKNPKATEHPLAGAEAVAYAAGMAQRFVVVSDNGESWVLGGDPDDGEFASGKDDQHALPQLLKDGWSSKMVTPGSGTKDDSSYWLVLLEKEAGEPSASSV